MGSEDAPVCRRGFFFFFFFNSELVSLRNGSALELHQSPAFSNYTDAVEFTSCANRMCRAVHVCSGLAASPAKDVFSEIAVQLQLNCCVIKANTRPVAVCSRPVDHPR